METNEPIDHGYSSELTLSGSAKEDLRSTANWTSFLSVLGFIFIGLFVLLALFIGTFISMLGTEEALPFPPAVLSVIYLIVPAIYFFPVLYLYRFSSKVKTALQQENREALSDAFANLKSHYKFIGVLAIIVMSFYILAFLGSLFFGVLGMAGMGS